MKSSLILNGVTKAFGDHVAVNDLSLVVPAGSIYGFLGPNGAGKTTTLRMVMSILMPDVGTISVLGSPSAAEVKDRLGYLPEEKGLYKKMKAADIIAYFGRLKGLNKTIAAERAVQLLERYGLGEWADKKCEALSKGMGQKVQILGTLIHEPDLVILDEPFSGLDPVNVELMRQIILDMKTAGRTVIFSTHVMEQAEQICDNLLLINGGEKVLDGTLAEIKGAEGKAIQVEYTGDGSVFGKLTGVARVTDAGQQAEIIMEDGIGADDILAQLVGVVGIRRFEVAEPSLHEIFIRSVSEEVAS
jgi:ABC-2 type transport system ATP-binding protein